MAELLFLLRIQGFRYVYGYLDVQVPLGVGTQRFDAAPLEADLGAGLDAGRYLDALVPLQSRHIQGGPQAGGTEGDRAVHKEVTPLTGEDRIRKDADDQEQIAGRSAASSISTALTTPSGSAPQRLEMLAFQACAFGASSAADSMKTSKGTSITTGPGRPVTIVFHAWRTASGTISPRVG